MAKITWDGPGERLYETGCDRGVLYIPTNGVYLNGYAWNGLTGVTESPTGAEANAQYADNIKYVNLLSAEDFSATIEAFTYPSQFNQCDGSSEPTQGVLVGQQTRVPFGLSYRTLVGNDTLGTDYGYKLHLVYGCLASPSEKTRATVNDSPEALGFSWDVSTTPVNVPNAKPSATLTIESKRVSAAGLAVLEDALYGTAGTTPRLPLPVEVIAMFSGTVTQVTPGVPTYNATTDVITIPSTTGVVYYIDGNVVSGSVTITQSTVVRAVPAPGYKFPATTDDDWLITFA